MTHASTPSAQRSSPAVVSIGTQRRLPLPSSLSSESACATPAPKVLAVLPVKGGAGATFLATNLAHALANTGKRVALLDLNLHFGEASLYVSEISPTQTMADVAAQLERLDGTLLEASMLHVATNFWLLAAPDSPEKSVNLNAANITRVIALAREHFDCVVLDVSRALDANAIAALDCAERIYLVLQSSLPHLRNAARLIDLFRRLGYPDEHLHVLVNRYERTAPISLQEIEATLGKLTTRTLPNSFRAVALSINQGRPLLDFAPRDPVAKALRVIASELAQTTSEHWLGRTLKRFA